MKTVRAVYSSGSESSGWSEKEACSSSEKEDSFRLQAMRSTTYDQVDLSDDQRELMRKLIINFCKILNKLQDDLANYIRTAYMSGALTEQKMKQKQACMSDCMFQFVSVAFNAIAKLQTASSVLIQFVKCFSDALVFVSELQAAQIVPRQFVQFFSYMLACLDQSHNFRVNPVEILKRLIAQLNTAQKELLKEEIKQQANECPICLSRLKGSLIVLPCHPAHVFHDECIRAWVAHEIPSPCLPSLCKWCRSLCLKYFYQFNKPSCPLCKQNFNPIDLGLIGDCCQMPT